MILRTRVEITYDGVSISEDIAPDLLSFTFNDHEGGKADDVELSLKNEHGKWSGPWIPERGDKLIASIVQEGEGAGEPLPCGTFEVDELDASGAPSVVSIRGVSMPTDSPITRTKRSRAWEKVRLSKIAEDVAKAGGLDVLFEIDPDPSYDRRDQREETDLAFLRRVCEDEGFIVKCTGERLVVFDPRELEGFDPIATLELGTDRVKGWRFVAQNHDVFTGCSVEYKPPRAKKLRKFIHGDEEGKLLKLTKRAASLAEAERMAKAALYNANRKEITGSLTVQGDTRLVAGATVVVEGFGYFSGKYLIRSAKHTVSSGYETTLELSATREG